MSNLKITILGNGSAVPTSLANPSSQLLKYKGKQFLFDCGEGTQMQMIKFKIKHRKLNHIFISHLHGDHFYGLIGLLSTFHLYGRKEPLTIYAPTELEGLIRFHLIVTKTVLKYDIKFESLELLGDNTLFEDNEIEIKAFALKHSIPSWGFVFREKPRSKKIIKEFVIEKGLTTKEILSIKQGNDYVDANGITYSNNLITILARKPVSYAYCSDTAYYEPIVKYIEGVDLLYHEATFDNSMENIAKEKQHSTARQAAQIAKLSNAKKLLLGHFSARFSDRDILLQEAKSVFSNTLLSEEGRTYSIEN